jgi:acylphosphatase
MAVRYAKKFLRDEAMIGLQRVARVTVGGGVQGVGYRAWIQGEARARHLTGWVRNRSNGDVEALLLGRPDAVEALSELCWQGPPLARVERVEVAETDAATAAEEGVGPGFHQIATV